MRDRSPVETLLAGYPRTRPSLSAAQQARYTEHYRQNRSGTGPLFRITAALESWMHRAVAGFQTRGAVLEIGGGNLNHAPYEHGALAYDVVEPFRALWHDSQYRSSVRAIYDDIGDIEPDRKYGRIFSIAVLEHLTDLPLVVAKSGLLLAPDGRMQAAIPTEGGFLWGLAWRVTTGVVYRLQCGEEYGRIMRHEHINDALEIQAVLEYFFQRVTLRRFPLPAFHLSFYTYLEAVSPHMGRCAEFCRNRAGAGD